MAKKPTAAYVACIAATGTQPRLYFVNGKFLPCSQTTATQFPTIEAAYDAMRDAYKAYRITGDQMNAYTVQAQTFRPAASENDLAASDCFVARHNR